MTLEPEYWYYIKDYYLDNIEPKDIENAIKENKLIKIHKNESNILDLMNYFIGNKFSDKDIKEMLINKNIDINNEKYK